MDKHGGRGTEADEEEHDEEDVGDGDERLGEGVDDLAQRPHLP